MKIIINREYTLSVATCKGIKTLLKQSSLLSEAAQNTSCRKPDLKYKRS